MKQLEASENQASAKLKLFFKCPLAMADNQLGSQGEFVDEGEDALLGDDDA